MAMAASKAADPGPPGPDPVPTLPDLGCRRRDGDVTAGGGGSLVPCSGARAAMSEHGTRTRCIHGAWLRRGAGRARAPGRRWQGSSSQGRRRRGRARLAAAGHELSRLVETWLGNQYLAKSLHGLRAALEVPNGVRGWRPAALSSRAPQLLFKGGEGSSSFSVPALRRRVGNSPGEILARRYAVSRQQRHLQVPSPPWRCCFEAFPPTCWYGRACTSWSDAGWDGSIRRNPSPASAGAVTDDALRRRGPPWR
ncbi:hypothetical protein SETIT_3G091500v2 [Setaria italica]|uniref:Uncharacterized protein n=1 Tax=Setaria italica TaxID=4555 RepID=A0A368QCZ4_SETIT|nr:hypothetical protein SETIT_3G091500v2 [Setaria italica]